MFRLIKDTKNIELSSPSGTIDLQSNALILQFGNFSGALIIPTLVRASVGGKQFRILIVDMNRVIQIASVLLSMLIITSIKRK